MKATLVTGFEVGLPDGSEVKVLGTQSCRIGADGELMLEAGGSELILVVPGWRYVLTITERLNREKVKVPEVV